MNVSPTAAHSESEQLPNRLTAAARVFVRHPSPRLLIALTVAAWMGRGIAGAWHPVDALIAGLVFAWWPFQEWLIHVFILHFRPVRIGDRVWDPKVSQKHRAHHAHPEQPDLIFIPLHTYAFSLPLLVMFAIVLAPDGPRAWSLLAVFATLSLHYEWVHFLVHTRYRPKTRLYRRMWRHHRLHHFKNEHYWFGVTQSVSDRALNTLKPAHEVELSKTVRMLQ